MFLGLRQRASRLFQRNPAGGGTHDSGTEVVSAGTPKRDHALPGSEPYEPHAQSRQESKQKQPSSPAQHVASSDSTQPAVQDGNQGLARTEDAKQHPRGKGNDKSAKPSRAAEANKTTAATNIAMVSSAAPAKSYYAPINPNILGGFIWEGDGTFMGQNQSVQQQQQQQQPLPQKRPASVNTVDSNSSPARVRYRPYNPDLLSGFDDDLVGGSGSSTRTSVRGSGSSGAYTVGTTSSSESSTRVTPRQGYLPTSDAILSGFEELASPVEISKRNKGKGKEPQAAVGGDPRTQTATNNPYHQILLEARKKDAAEASARNKEQIAPADLPGYDDAVDFGFGQRYQTGEKDAVVITNRRTLLDVTGGVELECVFPRAAVTKSCNHAPKTCLDCVAMSIRTDLNTKLWNEIKCPECGVFLAYEDVQQFADEETKERYQVLTFRYAISEAENFLWCTSGCGYGQVHDGGLEQPIVICMLCNHRSCFHHKAAWHENLTCDEFDSLKADPVNFRSRFELENEAAEEAAAARRAQEDADRAFARSLLAAEQREIDRERMEREEQERKASEAQKRREKAERDRKARQQREAAARRKVEDEASAKTVARVTKPCPGCRVPIEKNNGW
ncbi:hypothetical protein B0H67DRAFT_558130 [Lasiosphaeris hirsuta]|uniref:RBR-type E3 ubiquitin transferase n=1 Tax=Lasiosphaeris hirsuta TaxID=260670 RepID=A0AA39ZXR9_9PEZI|nr:hypothetical protein B0H67DRAFT_558130 [Lasiosphaeris hirsuta]